MFPLQSFKEFIVQNDLITSGQRVLLAVSGGRDSVLMVHLFKLAGFRLGIAHCNFNLRAEESLRDENFVRLLAANLDVPFYVKQFDTKGYAKANRCSTQMAARDLRYAWFEELREQESYDLIAVAHHQNDAIETLLLNLTRGTGISGLHGILPKRDQIIRPLLFLSRPEIERIIDENNISYLEDSSNLSDYYARNKVRLHVIPHLKDINPNLEHTFAQNIRRFAETEAVMQQVIAGYRAALLTETRHGYTLPIEKVKSLNPLKFLLYELLKPYQFSEYVIADLIAALGKQSGTSFYSISHRITINREELLISRLTEETPGSAQIVQPTDQQIVFMDQLLNIIQRDSVEFEKTRTKAYVDHDLLIYPLRVRGWQQGDTFVPLGMKNHKKLSDFFVDEKVPLPEKERIPIVFNGNGEVVWIAGMRQDNRYKIMPGTKKVVIFELKYK
jgi:tRNA(Ile)-lysidine synthase